MFSVTRSEDTSQTYDVNPVLTDRAEFEDIEMNESLGGHIIMGDFQLSIPSNDDSPLSINEDYLNENDDLSGLLISDADYFENQFNITSEELENGMSNYESNDQEVSENLHLHVSSNDVIDMGNNIIIDGSEITFLSFQDEGWEKVEEMGNLPEGTDISQGYDTYIHDSGAIIQIDDEIEITPTEYI